MRLPVGIDINGWVDGASRDWSPEEPDVQLGAPHRVDGGIYPVVVAHDRLHVGGPQASVSPIGRGGGWGQIGAPEKRRAISTAWDRLLSMTPDPADAKDIAAAVAALSQFADHRIVCIPDRPEMDEERQRLLLQALLGTRQPDAKLVWRSVALLLGMLDGGRLKSALDGSRVACLIHEPDGFVLQTFTVRSLSNHPGWLAPERGGVGQLHPSRWGLASLLDHARNAVEKANPNLAVWGTEPPRMPAVLLFEPTLPDGPEIVRRDNGNWARVDPPAALDMPYDADLALADVDADMLLLLTPLASRHHSHLSALLRDATGLDPIVVAPEVAARGALYAARRMARDIPHYLDRLDPIALVVARDGAPVFEDLIGPEEFVPGNREYISKPIEHLAWPAGMDRAEFYICKGAEQIRRWNIEGLPPPARAQALVIQLRQTPAQGWARLSITSAEWETLRSRPIMLDWNGLEAIDATREEVLAKLARPRPVVPQRLRISPDIGLWDGSMRAPGLASALRDFHAAARPSLHDLSQSLASGYRNVGAGQRLPFFAVGSDGDLPVGLDPHLAGQLDAAIEMARQQLRAAMAGRELKDNGALRALTWIFARCPAEVRSELFQAARNAADRKSHPFLAPPQARTVVVQGLGRVTIDEAILREAIPLAVAHLDNTNFMAALAAMLSRAPMAPAVLSSMDVEHIADRIRIKITSCIMDRKFNIGFRHALTSIVGVLRVREYDPWALLSDRSSAANIMHSEVERAANVIGLRQRSIRAAQALLSVLPEIAKLLAGREGRPDILEAIEAIEVE